MHEVLSLVLPALGLGLIILMLVEVRQYRAGRRLLSRRRFALRLLAGAVLIGILAAVFCGLFVLGLAEPGPRPVEFLAYWSGCVLLGVFLMVVMLADMKEVEARQTERQHQMWREIARLMISRRRGEAAGSGCSDASQGALSREAPPESGGGDSAGANGREPRG